MLVNHYPLSNDFGVDINSTQNENPPDETGGTGIIGLKESKSSEDDEDD